MLSMWWGALRRERKGKKLAASGAESQRGYKDVCLRLQYIHKRIGSSRDLS